MATVFAWLSPLDFFLWGYLKSEFTINTPDAIEGLKAYIICLLTGDIVRISLYLLIAYQIFVFFFEEKVCQTVIRICTRDKGFLVGTLSRASLTFSEVVTPLVDPFSFLITCAMWL